MTNRLGKSRSFLFLQGPHGPFFGQLARMLSKTGARTARVGFNRGDQAFWKDKSNYIPHRGRISEWSDHLKKIIQDRSVTDIVLYGDTRPVHSIAAEVAKAAGITVHVFEEGYLRPFWATYERDGTNGHSRLMEMSVTDMRNALAGRRKSAVESPDHWGDMRQHIFYGALYHAFVLLGNWRYKAMKTHRDISVLSEFRLYLRRLVLMPWYRLARMSATRAIRSGGFPYHLALLQLEHDANFQAHSPFKTTADYIQTVIRGFAVGAPAHHHLVFKSHPLEDGRVKIRKEIRQAAKEFGISDRVHFVRGGKLASLLDPARSVVTVNSTAAQQALWRGLPLKAFGAAVYGKPEFVSDQPMEAFFADPERPDTDAYADYRQYMLETSQVPGGFYSSRGRKQAMRRVVDMLLAVHDPYDALTEIKEAPKQQLRLVR